jgi:regulator of cell morphogenesis and NO signaling
MQTARAATPIRVTDPTTHVADLVTGAPSRAAVFEQLGIEYCCGGRVPLADACAEKGLAIDDVVALLDASTDAAPVEIDLSSAGIEELIANVVDVHHALLRTELPRAAALASKVARAHGGSDARLVEARGEVDRLVAELAEHLESEEVDVFPVCVRLATGETVDQAELGQLLEDLEDEHGQVAERLVRLRDLLDDFVPPPGACTSYRAYLDTLERVEADIHVHVHKENHVLFGRVRDSIPA